MHINRDRGELNVKIVYYGPAYSGKTTNLERLYATTHPARRSELTSVKNSEDRTLFFDFLQIELGKVGGLVPRINLYTVPGQVMYEVTRQIVLRGADAVIFVADSQAGQFSENFRSWQQLQTHLSQAKLGAEKLPVVIQFNKRDVPDAMPIEMLRKGLHLNGQPCVEAQALRDVGTRETLRAAIKAVLG
jgi:hypothetical protein